MSLPRMYTDLAPWWHLLSAPEEYAEEAAFYRDTLIEHTPRAIREVLELGSGGGNNASHLTEHWDMTLVDLSPDMLAMSERINPGVEHLEGDMRTVRLGRDFDAVLVHDAIMYMTTEQDLRTAIATAAAHLRPDGAALFVPDDTAESYVPETSSGGNDGDGRAIRYLQWDHPHVEGTTVGRTTFVYVLEEDGRTRVEHEEHTFGLFEREVWLRTITDAGLDAIAVTYEHSTFQPDRAREVFLGVLP